MLRLIVGSKSNFASRTDGVKGIGPRKTLDHSFMFDYL
jgi:hypothetical protein